MNAAQIPTDYTEIMQIRSMKPRFFDDEILGNLPPLTRLLFIGLYFKADKEGRLADKPRSIKRELLGYDDVTAEQVDGMLEELQTAGLIARNQGEGFLQVVELGGAK